MKYVVVLDIEPKDEHVLVEYPKAMAVRRRLADVLNDVTKHDETIGWRVTSVQSLAGAIDGIV